MSLHPITPSTPPPPPAVLQDSEHGTSTIFSTCTLQCYDLLTMANIYRQLLGMATFARLPNLSQTYNL